MLRVNCFPCTPFYTYSCDTKNIFLPAQTFVKHAFFYTKFKNIYQNNIRTYYSTLVPPHKTYRNFFSTQFGYLLPLRFDSRRKNEVNRTLLRFARQMVILFFILNFSFFLCSFLPEASCAKKLAHCGKSCFALLAVRLPCNWFFKVHRKTSLFGQYFCGLSAILFHAAHITVPQCLDHNMRSKPCIVQITAKFHEHGIDWLMLSMIRD